MLKNFKEVKSLCFTTFLKYNYKLFHPRKKPSPYESELIAYRKECRKYRLKNIQLYWERQTEVENEFLDNYNKQQYTKQQDDLKNFRTSIAKIAFHTLNANNFQSKRQNELKARIEKHELNEEMKRMNRKRIIKLLTLESKDWFNKENIEQTMTERMIIPDHVYDQTDYYLKLQEKAILFEIADYEGLELAENDVEGLRIKNKLLIPAYGEVVALIKHLKNDEVSKLNKEYEFAKAEIKKTYTKNSEKLPIHLEKIENAYKTLIAKYYEKIKNPKKKIEILQTKLILLYNLLTKWKKYTYLLKISTDLAKILHDTELKNREINFESENMEGKEENKEGLTDALQTAEEKVTSDSDGEIDLSKEKEIEQKDEKELKETLEKFKNRKSEEEGVKIKTEKSEIDSLFEKLDDPNETNKFEKDYEENLLKSPDTNIYGGLKRDTKDIRELLKIDKLDLMFPKRIIEDIQNFEKPKMEFSTIEEIIQHENQYKNHESPELLSSSAIVEIYKKELYEMNAKENLSKNEKKNVNELIDLINKIGEIKVDEPRMLLKIWEAYDV